MTRKELHELAKDTADPLTLSEEVIAEMKEKKVGPWWLVNEDGWDEAFKRWMR